VTQQHSGEHRPLACRVRPLAECICAQRNLSRETDQDAAVYLPRFAASHRERQASGLYSPELVAELCRRSLGKRNSTHFD
jgi:hypothetical protein